MTESILVAIDGSAHSEKALRFACRIAAQDGATLHLLHIAQPPNADHTLVLGAAAITVHDSRENLEQAGNR